MWKREDIKFGKNYTLLLCYEKNGTRKFLLNEINSDKKKKEGVFAETKIVSNELLQNRNLNKIAELILLENGQKFYVDAHGMWLTHKEVEALENGLSFDKIPWNNNLPPKFAPK